MLLLLWGFGFGGGRNPPPASLAKIPREGFFFAMVEELPKEPKWLADFWGTSRRTMERYINDHGRQMWSVAWVRQWSSGAARVPDAIRSKLRELEEAGRDDNESPLGFLAGDEVEDDPKDDLNDLLAMKSLYKRNLARALSESAHSDIKLWNTEIARITESIRKTRLMNDRLGITEGDTLTREAAERLAFNLVLWCMRSVDTAKADLCKRLCGLDFPEEVQAVLEPYLLSALVYQPLTRSVEQEPSGAALPSWFVDALKAALDEFVFDDEGKGGSS